MKTFVTKVILLAVVLFPVTGHLQSKNKATGQKKIINETRDYLFNKKKRVYSPSTYTVPKYKNKKVVSNDIIFRGCSQNFYRGQLVYLEITPALSNVETFKVSKVAINKKIIPMQKYSWGYRGFWGGHPTSRPGKKTVIINYVLNGKPGTMKTFLNIKMKSYPVYRKPLNVGKFSDTDYQKKPEVIKFIKECTEKKKAAFRSRTRDSIGEISAHPRNYHYITSPFWAKRIYLRYKKRKGKKIRLKNRTRIHYGLDFRGKTGEPVYVLADGKVVLADKLHYEGNMVIVDHGNRIFSYYMHMDAALVKAGDIVKAGDQIGKVGSTGVSTGSHLHVSLTVRGMHVNPLSILGLPLRK